MYEVEAKVALSKADLKRLKSEIPSIASKIGHVDKKDVYYGCLKKHCSYLRVRKKNGKPFLNIKTKKTERGIETNREIKLPLTSMQAFQAFLKKIGLPLAGKKHKKGVIYRKGEMQIELNKVEGLGDFLEIETMVAEKSDIPGAKKALRNLFKKLGFSPEEFEKKYYLELLEEKRKNNN